LPSRLRESPMCPKDLTPNCVLDSPSTTTHIARKAKARLRKVVLTRRLLAYQQRSASPRPVSEFFGVIRPVASRPVSYREPDE